MVGSPGACAGERQKAARPRRDEHEIPPCNIGTTLAHQTAANWGGLAQSLLCANETTRGGSAPVSFERLFHPRAIAIIGASSDLTRIGGHPIKALQNAGYRGSIFLVNPKYTEIHGLKCYPDAAAIGQACDLAIVAVPAPAVAQAIRDCGKAKIPFAVVLTAGFRETGAGGRKLEHELKRAIADSGVRIVGPNCQGMLSLESRVFAAFGSVAYETEFRVGS